MFRTSFEGSRPRLDWRAVALLAGGLLFVYYLVPILALLTAQNPLSVLRQFESPAVVTAATHSVLTALASTGVATAFGVPLAYLLTRGFRGQAIVESLVDLPLVVPHSVAGILILFGFGRRGLFPGVSVLTTMVGMVLALTFVSAPFAVNAAREAFEAIDPRLEYAARSHGAGPFGTFVRVMLPLASRGVLTGGVLAWARGVSEFGAVAVVAYSVYFFYPFADSNPSVAQHAPVYIFNTYTASGLDEAGAVAFILLALTLVVFLLVRQLAYDRGGGLL